MLSLSFSSPDSISVPSTQFTWTHLITSVTINGCWVTRLAGLALPFADQTFRFRMIGSFLVSGQLSPPEVLPLRRTSLLFSWVAFYQKPKGYWVYRKEEVYPKLLFLSVVKLEIFRLSFKIQSAFLLTDTSIIEINPPPPPLPFKKENNKRIDWVPATFSPSSSFNETCLSYMDTLYGVSNPFTLRAGCVHGGRRILAPGRSQ